MYSLVYKEMGTVWTHEEKVMSYVPGLCDSGSIGLERKKWLALNSFYSLAEFVKFPCECTVAQRDILATKKFAGYNEWDFLVCQITSLLSKDYFVLGQLGWLVSLGFWHKSYGK